MMTINTLLDAIKYIPSEFGVDEDSCEVAGGACEVVDMGTAVDGWDYATGCSKMVFFHPQVNEVIKMPFNGFVHSGYEDYDETTGEYEWVDEYSFSEFYCTDYCTLEYNMYLDAVEAGFGEFFPATRPVAVIDGYHIYAQEKIETYFNYLDRSNYTVSEEQKTSARKLTTRIDATWTAAAIERYGEERVNEFLNFLHEAGMDRDLHNNNIGFGADGRPMLCDWCGFDC